jgi:putative heme utilization radical SAM enzyme HutW
MSLDLTRFYAAADGLPFPDRRAVMPWRPQQPVPPQEIPALWQALCQRPLPANKRLVYLHIPFCATHCKFCGFYQNKLEAEATEQYCDYLIREIEQEAGSPLHQSAPVHAVYFGGGTPTALSAKQLHRIISTLRRTLPLAPDCEITVEGRVLNFDDERIDACLDAGANRFSIGIQTFNTRIRQRMGRRASREEAIQFLRKLGQRDLAAVVCDLMFGLPEQTPESWREDLRTVCDLPLDGVDLYALNLLPSTPLGKAVENKRVTLPDVSQRRDFYLEGEAFLARDGWHQISNSHWARTTRERNLYNLLIKKGADCLAFGSGAGGNLAGQSYMTARSLEMYYQQMDAGQKPIMMMTAATTNEHRWRLDLQGGIEGGRYDLSRIITDTLPLEPLLQQWQQRGLMHSDGPRFTLTPAGRFWASNVLQALQTLVPQLTLRNTLHANG